MPELVVGATCIAGPVASCSQSPIHHILLTIGEGGLDATVRWLHLGERHYGVALLSGSDETYLKLGKVLSVTSQYDISTSPMKQSDYQRLFEEGVIHTARISCE